MEEQNCAALPDHVGLNLAEDKVRILDQSLLPGREEYLELSGLAELQEAIGLGLRVRGAPAIGIFAGYALYVLARQIKAEGPDDFLRELEKLGAALAATRPTAVNLSWAVKRMLSAARENLNLPREALLARLCGECRAIHREDAEMCRAIARYGLSLVKNRDGVLTHCNAGPLATSQYGTALGPILLGRELGVNLKVFADETRPLLQGARLTAWELQRAGVDVTLICDNMASMVMKNGWVQACFVGCDRVAANGDAANKIGTSGVAILAKHYGIPFYVLGPTSTIDMSCPDGAHIPIEERDPAEIREKWYAEPMAPAGVKCFNPAFDVTDHDLITAIVTERGICYPPFTQSLGKIMGQEEVMAFETEKAALREEICHAAHQIARAGYVATNDGNLSARCPDGHILVTPTGMYKGDVEPEDLLEVDLDGEKVAGQGGPSSETPMHLAIYRRFDDIGGVVHTHSPYALCMASRGKNLTAPITADMVLLLGNIPCLPYLPLGGTVLAEEVAKAGEDANGVLLAHHGSTTWGRDLREAWYRTQALEQYCYQLYLQLGLGGALPIIPREEVEALIARRRAGGTVRGGGYRYNGI